MLLQPEIRLPIGAIARISQGCPSREQICHIDGEDLFKIHIQLSGRLLVSFNKDAAETLVDGASTVLLAHCLGMRKVERVSAGHKVQAITIAMPLQKVRDTFEGEPSDLGAPLRDLIYHKRKRFRVARTAPSSEERVVASSILRPRIKSDLGDIYLQAKLVELFCLVMNRFQQSETPQHAQWRLNRQDRVKLLRVRDLLSEHYLFPPVLADLARQFGLNRNKLCGGFRRLFGATVYDYCKTMRLDKAQELIIAGDLSIKEIAYAAGFSSQNAFSTAFTRHFGRSPSALRIRQQ